MSRNPDRGFAGLATYSVKSKLSAGSLIATPGAFGHPGDEIAPEHTEPSERDPDVGT